MKKLKGEAKGIRLKSLRERLKGQDEKAKGTRWNKAKGTRLIKLKGQDPKS